MSYSIDSCVAISHSNKYQRDETMNIFRLTGKS